MLSIAESNKRLSRIKWLLSALIILFLMIWLLPPLEVLQHLNLMSLPMHMFAETFAIVVSILVFALVFNSYTGDLPTNTLILVCAFLVVGLLDFAHTLSYPGMPDWVTPGSTEKAINFWLLARFVAAIALLTVALRPWQALSNPHTRNRLLTGSLILTAFLYWLVLYHPEIWPRTFIQGQGLTPFKVGAEYVLVLILLVPAILFYLKAKQAPSFDAASLFAATAITILSELCFTLYSNTVDIFNLLGHLYKILAYVFIFKAVFVASVREPLNKLKESEYYNRMLFESSPIGLALCQMDGVLVDVNQAYANILGRDIEETKGLMYWQITPQDYAQQEQNKLESLRKNKIYGPYEKKYLHKDGHRVPVRLSGKLIERQGEPFILSSVEDISIEVKTARALYESEQHFRQLTENISEVFWLSDTEKEEMIYISPAYEAIWGQTCESLYANPVSFLDAIHPDDRRRVESAVARQKDGPYDEKYRIIRPDGAVRWIRDRSFPIQDQSSVVYRVAGIAEDITATKMAHEILEQRVAERTEVMRHQERDLILAKEEAERANNAKSDFLSRMSHELRTPLNAILGFSQMLEMDTQLNNDQRDNVNEIHLAGNHLLELVNELLDLARIESGNFDLTLENLDLLAITRECMTLATPLGAQYGVTLSVNKHCVNPTYIYADSTRLRQIVLNLISNGIKYNKKGGSVEVECSGTAEGNVRLSVKDTGKGISKERFAELFTPFKRLDAGSSEVEGTGIGLTIVKQLVEIMGGNIGVHSEQGQGSTFWVDFLPSASVTTGNIQTETGIYDTNTHQISTVTQRTILYIEDDKANLLLVEKILAKTPGYTLIASMQAEHGIGVARQRKPDLILLDINLPGMNGYQALEKLNSLEETRNIPVIAITANAMDGDINHGKESGFKDYLTKPINIQKFMKVIERWAK